MGKHKSASHAVSANRRIVWHCVSTSLFLIVFWSLTLGLSNPCRAQNDQFHIGYRPDWVEPLGVDYKSIPSDHSGSSYRYLLLDNQLHITKQQEYHHVAIRMQTTEAIQEMSTISVTFDPDYEQLIFHSISIIRDGAIASKLDYESMQVVQRETNMERHMYDGSLTAFTNLSDVRVGDIIEYSYSLIGFNPVYMGHYSGLIYQQYSMPIDRLYFRLISPENTRLQIKPLNDAAKPDVTRSGNEISYTWDLSNVPAKFLEPNVPEWYDPYPYYVTSDWQSWETVADWATSLFTVETREQRQIDQYVEKHLGDPTADSTIINVIRFVQDEIRYLGMLDGVYSHQPHKPLQVLKQRYGDCKDKSLLLATMLRACNLTADPVMVNSLGSASWKKYLPSPYIFDHCIVCVEKDGKSFFIDPTASSQGGDLEHIYGFNYDFGLIIRPGITELTTIPRGNYSRTSIEEVFTLEPVGQGAVLNVRTVHTGAMADIYRGYFAGQDKNAIQQSFLEYYSYLYPYIQATADVKIIDERDGENNFTIEEQYHIDSIWQADDDNSNELYCEFMALYIYSFTDLESSPARTMPYDLDFPIDAENVIVLNLPEEWYVENDFDSLGDDYFSYTNRVTAAGDSINIVHRYKTFAPFVEAKDANRFKLKHDKITEHTSYGLSYNKSMLDTGFRLSPLSVTVLLISLIASIILMMKLYYQYDIEPRVRDTIPPKIGGWLTLIALGLIVSPINLMRDMADPNYFNGVYFDILFNFESTTRNLFTGLLILLELAYNVALVVYVFFLGLLFFKKRTIFPRCMIAFYIIMLSFNVIDALLSYGLNPDLYTNDDAMSTGRLLMSNVIGAAIWIPYFLVSKRVKETFLMRSPRYYYSHAEPAQNDILSTPSKTSWKTMANYIFILCFYGLAFIAIIYNNFKETDTSPEPASFAFQTTAKNEGPDWQFAVLYCLSRDDSGVHAILIKTTDFESAETAIEILEEGVIPDSNEKTAFNRLEYVDIIDLGQLDLSDFDAKFQAALADVSAGEYTGIIEMAD